MYYYENEYSYNVEDLIMDYLVKKRAEMEGKNAMYTYQKVKDIDYMPITKALKYLADVTNQTRQTQALRMPMSPNQPIPMPMNPAQPMPTNPNQSMPTNPMQPMPTNPMQPMPTNPNQSMPMNPPPMPMNPNQQVPTTPPNSNQMEPIPNNTTPTDIDPSYIRQIYGTVARRLSPYVIKVIDEMEYEGSPILEDYIDPETLSQITDRILEAASKDISEIAQITDEASPERQIWGRYELLKELVDVMVVAELYAIRKKYYN